MKGFVAVCICSLVAMTLSSYRCEPRGYGSGGGYGGNDGGYGGNDGGYGGNDGGYGGNDGGYGGNDGGYGGNDGGYGGNDGGYGGNDGGYGGNDGGYGGNDGGYGGNDGGYGGSDGRFGGPKSSAADALTSFYNNQNGYNYNFGYDINDYVYGNQQSRHESGSGDPKGSTKGSYSVVEPDGSLRTVNYVADWVNGFRAIVSDKNGVTQHGYNSGGCGGSSGSYGGVSGGYGCLSRSYP